MSVFGNDIIQRPVLLESIIQNMKSDVEHQLRVWNTDYWYRGLNHTSEYMTATFKKQFCAYFYNDFYKIGLNVWNIVVYVRKKKHGYTGENIKVIVVYRDEVLSNGFDLFNIDFDFQYNIPFE